MGVCVCVYSFGGSASALGGSSLGTLSSWGRGVLSCGLCSVQVAGGLFLRGSVSALGGFFLDTVRSSSLSVFLASPC